VRLSSIVLVVAGLALTGPAMAQDRPKGSTVRSDALAPAEQPRRVLILYTDRVDLPANIILDRSIRSALTAAGVGPIDFYAEHLDVSRFPGEDHAKLHSDFLQRRYADKKPDVVITISDSAVDFLVRHGAGLFPGTPIVVGSTEQRGIRNWPLPPGITGAVGTVQFRTTLELALALHPGTRRVLVAAGTSTVDRRWAEQTLRDLRQIAPDVEAFDTGRLTMAELLREVASQPPRTVIFYHTIFRDGAGEPFVPARALALIARVANAPVYGVYETHLGLGMVGGHLWSFEDQGVKAAEVALRILRGERPEDIPLVSHERHVYMFDSRQLARWGIDEARLPVGSVIRFREPSLWELYRGYVVPGVGLLLVQSGLITGLLVQRAQRRRAQRSLAERLRFETLLSDLSAMLSACPATEVDRQVETGLRRIVEDLALDRAAVWTLTEGSDEARLTHAWIREGVGPPPTVVQEKDTPRIFSQLRQGHVVRLLLSGDPSAEPLIDAQAPRDSACGQSSWSPSSRAVRWWAVCRSVRYSRSAAGRTS
jgi:hypothetical protein